MKMETKTLLYIIISLVCQDILIGLMESSFFRSLFSSESGQAPDEDSINCSEEGTRANATFLMIDDLSPRTLLPTQNIVEVCPDRYFSVRVCVENAKKGSILKLVYKDGQETRGYYSCVDVNLWLASEIRLTLTYKMSHTCPQEDMSIIVIKEDKDQCQWKTTAAPPAQSPPSPPPQHPPPPPPSPPPTTTTTTTARTTTAAPLSWEDGACKVNDKDSDSTANKIVTLPGGQEVLCDVRTDEGNWVVIQRRVKGDIPFNRNWIEYVNGFGNFKGNGDFWFGLEKIHKLCYDRTCQLRVDMVYDGTPALPAYNQLQSNGRYFAMYQTFRVAGKSDDYELTVANYHGTAYDRVDWNVGMLYRNGTRFSTQDKGTGSKNCAYDRKSGFWWGRCLKNSATNLNGVWRAADATGIIWYPLTGAKARDGQTMSRVELKVRPKP